MFDSVCRLLRDKKYDDILKIESKYRHLDTFSDDPPEDASVLYAFGTANNESSLIIACKERAIHYFERAKERMKDADADDDRQA